MFRATSCAQVLFTSLCRCFPPQDNEQMDLSFGSHPLALLYEAEDSAVNKTINVFEASCPTLFNDFDDIHDQTKVQRCKKIETFLRDKVKSLDDTQVKMLSDTIEKITRTVMSDIFAHIPQLINAMSVLGVIESTDRIDVAIWKNERHLAEGSRAYDLGRPELVSGEISYINGIMQSFENAKGDAQLLSDNLCDGKNIHGIYSVTHGALRDLKILFYGQMGFNPEPVQHLLEQWNAFFQRELLSKKRYLQICMSQGVIMVNLALEALPEEYRKRICVLAIAPAGFIPSVEGCQVKHFVKMNDIVPVAMASGRGRLVGDDPDIIKVPSDDGGDPHNPHGANYITVIKPFVEKYINENSIL